MQRVGSNSAPERTTTIHANPGRPPDPIPTGPPGAATHHAGPRSPLLPAADPALLRGRPRGAERRGRPAWTGRQPWLRWWSTRDSRPVTTAATATPRARRLAVSGPVDGAGAAALRPNPRTARRVRAFARKHPGPAPQLPLPFPTRSFPDRCPSRSVSWSYPH